MSTIPVEIQHPSGLQFHLNLSAEEIQRFNTDETYAEELLNNYYALYESGIVSGNDVNPCESGAGTNQEVPETPRETPKEHFSAENEEGLIRLVHERPPLFNHKLPLKERARDVIRKLWLEIIAELNIDITVETIAKKWKNIRDSFLRIRANIKKKIASGSSAEEKIAAERLREKHRHYDLLMFLEDTLTTGRTSTNLDTAFEEELQTLSPTCQASAEGLSTPRTSSKNSGHGSISSQDETFLRAITNLPGPKDTTPTQNFCLRLADGMDKLSPKVRNQLQVEFLQRLTEMESLYLYNE